MSSLGRSLFVLAFALAGWGHAAGGAGAATSRAEEVLAKARAAVGGAEKVRGVRGLTIKGKYRRVIGERDTSGENEVDLLLPDKFMRTESFAIPGMGTSVSNTRALNGAEFWSDGGGRRGGNMIVLRGDGRELTKEELEEAQKRQAKMLRAEMARLVLALLLTPPDDFPLQFAYVGEATADDGSAEVLDATGPEGFAARLFIDKQTHLPLMLTYRAPKPRMMMLTITGGGHNSGKKPEELEKEAREKLKQQAEAPPEEVEMQWRFSDYKEAGGLKLPHTISMGPEGETNEEWEIKSYAVNPQFRADKFQKK
ncbi:MAG TPA: hypothetical protein VN228_15665 [Pyrinomonadaceae bacterium]|nr:hypothetical protein [Pyrinomonadaceae bacterium]